MRDELWRWCRARWRSEMPDLEVFEGHHTGGYFNRSAAVNRAAALAGDWDVGVIIDSDIVIDTGQVRAGIARAVKTGALTRPFHVRHELNARGSRRIMTGWNGDWHPYVQRDYHDMLSSCIVVTRKLWDEVRGFDEAFVGWGFEDNAFHAACVTFGGPMQTLDGELWHLWHMRAPEGRRGSVTLEANRARARRYTEAIGSKRAIEALRGRALDLDRLVAGIPPILHRTVPEKTTPQVEAWWSTFQRIHPGWQFMTHRDPMDPEEWPLTGPHWDRCTSGAQKAGLIRLEALHRWGGVYVDSDVEPYRPLTPLLHLTGFAAWEDANCVPDAVMGAIPGHPALEEMLTLAIARIEKGAWESGPGVTTEVLPGRDDWLVLPPGAFYPYHYGDKVNGRHKDHKRAQPWAFVAHHWAASWLKAG